jgi:hypothetical protein
MRCNTFTGFVHATGVWALFALATMRPMMPIDERGAGAGSGPFASQLVLMHVTQALSSSR